MEKVEGVSDTSQRLNTVTFIMDALSLALCGTGHHSLCALVKSADHGVRSPDDTELSGVVLLRSLLTLAEMLGSQKSNIPFERALFDKAHEFALFLKQTIGGLE